MRRLISRLVSGRVRELEASLDRLDRSAMAEVWRLRGQRDQAVATADEARRQLDECRRVVEALRREAPQLRRALVLLDERLAAYEGRPPQHRLPPTRVRRPDGCGVTEALTEIIRQVPGDPTMVIPAVGRDA